jgi:DNA-binding MarR family transcriptional regulator
MPRPRRPKPDAVEALVAVSPLVTRWMERLLAAHEPPLTVSQYLALRAIGREELSGGELARRAGISGPAVSQLVATLSDAGLVERNPAEGDRRRHELSLSQSGGRTLESAAELLHERLAGLLGELPGPEADALARALPRVDSLLSGAPPPRRPRPPQPPPHPPRAPRA